LRKEQTTDDTGGTTAAMSITEVPVLPLRASRHLARWIVWHASGVSLVEDGDPDGPPRATTSQRRKRRRR
jgi:hypothetical protein